MPARENSCRESIDGALLADRKSEAEEWRRGIPRGNVCNSWYDTRVSALWLVSLLPSVQGESRARRSIPDVHEREACEQESVDRRSCRPVRGQQEGGGARA